MEPLTGSPFLYIVTLQEQGKIKPYAKSDTTPLVEDNSASDSANSGQADDGTIPQPPAFSGDSAMEPELNSEQPNNSGGTENTTGKVDEQDNLSHTTAKANSSSTTNAITNSSDKQLPSTGERNTFTIFGTAALMILASVGLVAKKKEQ